MSHALTFDTLAYAKKLKAAGFTDQQAEVQAETMAELIDQNLATKADIELLRKEIAELGYKLTIRMGGMLAIGISVLTALVKL